MIGFCVLLILAVLCGFSAAEMYFATHDRGVINVHEQFLMAMLGIMSAVLLAGAFACGYLGEIISQQKLGMKKRHCGCSRGSTCNPARPVSPPPDGHEAVTGSSTGG